MKAERNLTVYEMSGYHYKPTPTIMLKGQWLADLGFEAGDRIKVCCEDGRITILPTSPQEGENPGHKSVSVKKCKMTRRVTKPIDNIDPLRYNMSVR